MFVLELLLFLIIFCLPGQAGFWALPCGGQAAPGAVQAEGVLRFHVRANSNSPKDQEIKNDVARKILARFQAEWSRCQNSSELKQLLMENSPVLASAAREILQERGFDYDVDVSLTHDLFPARFYEGKLYPPGEYTALYLVIGEGRGENWWCVLFPPLCFNLLPPLAADDDAGEDKPENRQAGINTDGSSRAGAAADEEKKENKESKDGDVSGKAGGEQCEWRFWLWEKVCKIIKNTGTG